MKCSIADMRNKEVINLQDGTRLGFVGDVEIDTENAKLTTIIIYAGPDYLVCLAELTIL